ncbi:amidohydrolase [Sorangium sp. So ce726]|uniref:amidohydrolase family protein n=1 Tax=Sorangium sp. So ce726 TaxID=3133319 RepID=UPI003F617D37
MPRIDSHQHLVYRDRFPYKWTASLPALATAPFTLAEYRAAAASCDITGTVFMEVDVPEGHAGDEAKFFCALAEDPSSGIRGVVASGRPENADFPAHLEAIRHPKLKGIRRILYVAPDATSQGALFRRHVAALGAAGLTFDICVRARQLPLAAALADAAPATQLILDHCGMPDIAGGGLDPWRADLRELARRPNVACKISGLVTYAKPGAVTADALRPYVEHAVACFGWDRIVWGGDWPVCNLTSSLGDWVRLLDELLVAEPAENRAKLFHDNACRLYRL